MVKVCLLSMSAVFLLFLLGCGHDTQLASIDVRPSSIVIIGRGANAKVQFTADGHFVHPVETRDITTQVKWTSTFPAVASIDSNGIATSGLSCGVTVITATAGSNVGVPFTPQAITIATAQFTVSDLGDPACPHTTP